MSKSIGVGILLAFVAAGCGGKQEPTKEADGPVDAFIVSGKTDTGGISEDGAEAKAVLKLANEGTFELLDESVEYGGVGLDRRAAQNIIYYRLGDDQTADTEDDALFQTLAELDRVPYVGPVAFAKLLAFAQANGYFPSVAPATVATDKNSYVTGDTIIAKIENRHLDYLFLDGCSPVHWEKLGPDGRWTDMGANLACFWEGIAVKVPNGTSVFHELGAPEEGTWRLSVSISMGCVPGEPLSKANCTGGAIIGSEPFDVRNEMVCDGAWLDYFDQCRSPSDDIYPQQCCNDLPQPRSETECVGAWLDYFGQCRTPADGTYPDSCCADLQR